MGESGGVFCKRLGVGLGIGWGFVVGVVCGVVVVVGAVGSRGVALLRFGNDLRFWLFGVVFLFFVCV